MRPFIKSKVTNLMGETEVRMRQEANDQESEFTLIATAQGVRLSGNSEIIYDEGELDALAKGFDAIWREHKKLKPKFSRTLSGH